MGHSSHLTDLFSIPGETAGERREVETESEGGVKESSEGRVGWKKKNLMKCEDYSPDSHCRLQRLIPGVQSAEKTPTYNLTPPLTFLLGLL